LSSPEARVAPELGSREQIAAHAADIRRREAAFPLANDQFSAAGRAGFEPVRVCGR
jgi:hypothetical protein